MFLIDFLNENVPAKQMVYIQIEFQSSFPSDNLYYQHFSSRLVFHPEERLQSDSALVEELESVVGRICRKLPDKFHKCTGAFLRRKNMMFLRNLVLYRGTEW